jgi:hypothetical protein
MYDTYMEKIQPYTYTSPLTGTEYLVVPKEETRMVGDWYKGEPLRPETVVRYDVVLQGNSVQFAYTKEGVDGAVAHFEGVSDGWYCLPRD